MSFPLLQAQGNLRDTPPASPRSTHRFGQSGSVFGIPANPSPPRMYPQSALHMFGHAAPVFGMLIDPLNFQFVDLNF